jgi:hypothetical protein
MTMERTEVLDMMGELKLYGMKGAYDETLATALKRKHEPQQLVGDLLKAEISEKQARSIRYQLAIAKLPLAKDVDDFAFNDTPINENLVRDLAGGAFIAQQRNVVLVGGTGTGKTHLAIAIARSCIRSGSRGRFFTTVDLVNRLEAPIAMPLAVLVANLVAQKHGGAALFTDRAPRKYPWSALQPFSAASPNPQQAISIACTIKNRQNHQTTGRIG